MVKAGRSRSQEGKAHVREHVRSLAKLVDTTGLCRLIVGLGRVRLERGCLGWNGLGGRSRRRLEAGHQRQGQRRIARRHLCQNGLAGFLKSFCARAMTGFNAGTPAVIAGTTLSDALGAAVAAATPMV